MNKTAIRLTITLTFFMDMIDSTVLNTALPQMALSFHEVPLHLKVALTAYLLSLGVFIPISGWIADRFGTRNTYAWAIIIFTIGSLCCAFASTVPILVISRIIQGIGGAMMAPVGRLLVLKVYEPQEMVTTMSQITSVSLIAPIFGPVVGGAFTTYLTWRAIFLINIPFGLLGLWAVLRFIPQIKADMIKPFDWFGFILLGAGLGLLLWGFQCLVSDSFGGADTVAFFVGVFCLLGYVWYAHRVKYPIIVPALFKQRVFRLTLIGNTLARFGLAFSFILPLFFQLGIGHDAFISGVMIIPLALGSISMKYMIKPLLMRYGYRRLLLLDVVLLSVTAVSFTLMTVYPYNLWLSASLLFLYGLLVSLNFSAGNTLMYAELDPHFKSQSNSVGSSAQQICSSFSIAFAALIIEVAANTNNLMQNIPLEAFRVAFICMGLMSLLAFPIYWKLKPEDGHKASGHKF